MKWTKKSQKNCIYWRINFATNSVFPQLAGPATTHVNGWWKHSSIFLKQNVRQRRSTVLYNSTFFRFTRPIRYLWKWSEEQGEKTALFFIIDCVLQRRWANALPVFSKHNGLSFVACWAGRNENQEWFSNGVISTRTCGEIVLFMIFWLSVGFVNKKWCCW